MALKTELMARGIPAGPAGQLGLDALATLTAVGNSQATAAALVSNCTNINAGSGDGVIISQVHAVHALINSSGGNVTLYPPVGSSINGGAANAGFTLTTGKTTLVFEAGTNYIAVQSA